MPAGWPLLHSFYFVLGDSVDVGRELGSRYPRFACAFVVILATVRVGRRAKWLAAIPLLLFASRTVNMTQHFAAAQMELAGLAGSFEVRSTRGAHSAYRRRRSGPHRAAVHSLLGLWSDPEGLVLAYLMDTAGERHADHLRLVTPDGFWVRVYDEPPDWKQVESDYEYVWAYDFPRFLGALAGIGDRIFSFDALEVYRVRKLTDGSIRKASGSVGGTLILPRRSTARPAHVFCATWVRSGSILIRAGSK